MVSRKRANCLIALSRALPARRDPGAAEVLVRALCRRPQAWGKPGGTCDRERWGGASEAALGCPSEGNGGSRVSMGLRLARGHGAVWGRAAAASGDAAGGAGGRRRGRAGWG